jgi:hypothetical protein
MKRLSAALILGFLSLPFCFAQIQRGDASYNASKQGFTLSHSSLSFNTRVRVTNLRNNRSVEASVDGRIPIDSRRIADISRDAADALGMDKTGMTPVELAELTGRPAAGQTASTPESAQAAGTPQAQAAGTAQPAGESQGQNTGPAQLAGTPQAQAAGTAQPAGAVQGQSTGTALQQQSAAASQALPDFTGVPYGPGASCCCGPLLLAILLLLILIIAILVVILVLLLRRLLRWPWYYPLWLRRRRAEKFKRRNAG